MGPLSGMQKGRQAGRATIGHLEDSQFILMETIGGLSIEEWHHLAHYFLKPPWLPDRGLVVPTQHPLFPLLAHFSVLKCFCLSPICGPWRARAMSHSPSSFQSLAHTSHAVHGIRE